MHCEYVLSVDDLTRNPVAAGAQGDVAHRGRTLERRGRRVEVVLAEIDDRQLPDGRHVQALVEGPLVARTIAEEAETNIVRPARPRTQPGTRRHRNSRADDPRLTQAADTEVGEMHRAPLPTADAVPAAEELGHQRTQRGALADGMAVGAMGPRERVARAQRETRSHDRRLLTGRTMDRPRHDALGLEASRLVLEETDAQHAAMHLARELG
jgi:hypothetical protein